jgi:hypothetical protein
LELHPRSTVISFTFARNARTHLDPHAYLDIFGGDVRRKLQRWRDYREPKVRVNSGKGVLRGDRDHTRAEILETQRYAAIQKIDEEALTEAIFALAGESGR